MSADPREASVRLLHEYGHEPGRSAMVRVETPDEIWEHGLAADTPRPAASLLKLPLAMAVERAFDQGDLDPQGTVSARRLVAGDRGPGALHVLDPDLSLTAADVLGLCLALSDRSCAVWLLDAVGVGAVRSVVIDLECPATGVHEDEGPAGPLVGHTTGRDALRMVTAATDATRHPLTAHALHHTVRNSRIPLGADGLDVRIAHKTGGLSGVAHDVAVLDCSGGRLLLAFLTEHQHDTLVSGYEMGICTRGLLHAWGLAVTRSRGMA